MPWLVVKKPDADEWCIYKEGADGKPVGESRGCHQSESDARSQQRALYVHTEGVLNFIGSLKLEADAVDPRLLRFKNAVLARAEVNGNRDEVDGDGITELAATIAGMPISIEHNPQRKVGFFTAGNAESGTLFVDGALWTEALTAQNISIEDIEQGKQRLSVEAVAKTASCSNCQKAFESAWDYCEHLLMRAKTGAVRRLRGLTATGGGLTRKPAGTDTHLGTIYMVASHQEGNLNDVEGIERRKDVSEADKKRAESEAENFADPVNKKYKLDTESQIRAAWSYIGMPKNQKKYSSDEVSAIKRRIVSAWKKKIDKAGPPSAQDNKESATMADEITEMTSAAFVEALSGLSAKVEALIAAMHDDEDEEGMDEMKRKHMEAAQRVTELEAQMTDLQAKLDAAKQSSEQAENRATAAKLEALKFQLVGSSVMAEDEFESKKNELLGLNEATLELIFRDRPAPVAPQRPKVAASQGADKPQLVLA